MEKLIFVILSCFLVGCDVTTNQIQQHAQLIDNLIEPPDIQRASDKVINYPELDGPKITVAVYDFKDMTGQRKPGTTLAHLSSAVTQGGEAYLIETLKDIGNSTWFTVLERQGIDYLIKERQIIRQTREANSDKDKLQPLLFAGVLIHGSIIGYDSNLVSGGAGARLLGVGINTQYIRDTVTVGLRLISVSTGEVLLTSTTTKTVLSVKTQGDVFRWIEAGTTPVEAELGKANNEPVNIAVRLAIELAVCDIVQRGKDKELWSYKKKEDKIK